MVSKNQIKLIRKLTQKKYRNEWGLFLVEGRKSIQEFIKSGFSLHTLWATKAWDSPLKNLQIVTQEELNQISSLKQPEDGVAVFHKKEITIDESDIVVALDQVRDPGNLGTIIRLCDWFGISDLICSEQTVDCYNPKVIQATMGSLARVRVRYESLTTFLETTDRVPLAAVINGKNVYQRGLPRRAVLVMGNEANGISAELQQKIPNKISIPRFGTMQQAESLNVAVSTAILLSELLRR